MAEIPLDLASFNVIKYALLTIFFSPLTEFLLHRVVLVLSKKRLLVQGSVKVSKTRAGLWGLNSYCLGGSWYRRLFVVIPAVWLIASELLFEFSFDSSRRNNFREQPVLSTGVIPSWSNFVFSDNESVLDPSDYYKPSLISQIDFGLLFDGMSACQDPHFKEELNGNVLTIEQTNGWRQTHRDLDNITIWCGHNTDVEVTARLEVEESDGVAIPVQGVNFALNSSSSFAPDDIESRLIEFKSKFKQLPFSNEYGNIDTVSLLLNEDRIACVASRLFHDYFCVLEQDSAFVVCATYKFSAYRAPGGRVARKLFEVFPRNAKADPLLVIMESLAVSLMIGSLRPDEKSALSSYLTARQVREIMRLYLSIDSNGGHTYEGDTSVADVWDGDSPVIVIKPIAYVSSGLLALLIFILLATLLAIHAVVNRFRSQQLRRLDDSRRRRRLATNDIRLDLDLGYLLSVMGNELGLISTGLDGKPEAQKVVFRMANVGDNQQKIEILGKTNCAPRDYSRGLVGYGSKTAECCNQHLQYTKEERAWNQPNSSCCSSRDDGSSSL